MNETFVKIADQIVEDRQALLGKMVWESDSSAMATLAAFLYASAGKSADVEHYVECKKYFNKNVNVFSQMRGVAKTIVITRMALAENYQEYLEGVMQIYRKLRSIHKLTFSPYMVLTAINIYEGGGPDKADENIEKMETVYREMKGDHFFLTGDEDRPFLAMIVSRGMNAEKIADEVDSCYEAAKSMSFSKEAMHTVAQIMALSSRSPEEKTDALRKLVAAFKEEKVKGYYYELMPILAVLDMVPGEPEEKAADIREVNDYLRTQKGFKWTLANTKRTMYAALIYALGSFEADREAISTVLSSSVTNIVVQEIITMLIMTSCTTAAVRSYSSSKNGK